MAVNLSKKVIIGIDEAGRGPLAGPVAVAVVVLGLKLNGDLGKFKKTLRDSKNLSAIKRDFWYDWLRQKKHQGVLDFKVSLVGHKIIDQEGISRAVFLGINRCLRRLDLRPDNCQVLLDGSLKAPAKYKNQKTIIRGDETVPLIALASIAAKVRRDRRMIKLSNKYKHYGFERHKGYGTAYHIKMIKKFGPSNLHRRSFISRII